MSGVSHFLLFLSIVLPIAFAGLAIPPEQIPIKFLVLERGDILNDDAVPVTTDTSEDQNEEVTEGEIEVTEGSISDGVVEEVVKETIVRLWDPVGAWKELNFPVVPQGEGDFLSVPVRQFIPMTPDTIIPNIRGNTLDLKGVPCQCGNSSGKIVGGDAARINDIPWTVALVRNGFFGFGASKKPYCGGTLINNLYVLTASHCVDGQFAGGIKVWLNDEDYLIDGETSGRQEYFIDEIIMHKDYDRRTVNNDIALLKLSKPVPIGTPMTTIVPVCLPANNDADFSGLNATVAGWGLLNDGGAQSTVLRKVDVPVMTNEKCNSDATKYKGKISENMLCAGYDEGGKDSCQGDSGGPLIINNTGRMTLIGVVSWGFGCAGAKSPGVYSRVGRYPNWIMENTKDALWCNS